MCYNVGYSRFFFKYHSNVDGTVSVMLVEKLSIHTIRIMYRYMCAITFNRHHCSDQQVCDPRELVLHWFVRDAMADNTENS